MDCAIRAQKRRPTIKLGSNCDADYLLRRRFPPTPPALARPWRPTPQAAGAIQV
jgi:hypothetical protein